MVVKAPFILLSDRNEFAPARYYYCGFHNGMVKFGTCQTCEYCDGEYQGKISCKFEKT